MTDDYIDFSPLEPPDDEALARAIVARTTPLLAERRTRTTTIQLASWWPRVAAAAAIVAIASAVVLTVQPRQTRPELALIAPAALPRVRATLARELGVPPVLAISLTKDTLPTATEFLRSLGR